MVIVSYNLMDVPIHSDSGTSPQSPGGPASILHHHNLEIR